MLFLYVCISMFILYWLYKKYSANREQYLREQYQNNNHNYNQRIKLVHAQEEIDELWRRGQPPALQRTMPKRLLNSKSL